MNLRPFRYGLAVVVVFASTCIEASTTAPPDIVYLNGCVSNCALQAGVDDAINGKSTLVNGSVLLSAFPFSQATFDATAACVRNVLKPYNAKVVIADPGAIPRREIMLTGSAATQIGLPGGTQNDAKLDGFPHDNTIALVFASAIGASVDALCWQAAQVIGNLYGLDFVTSCSDIMGSASGCGIKTFADQDSQCSGLVSGSPGHCILGNTTQNSGAVLMTTPGPSDIIFDNGAESFQQPASSPSP